MGNTKHPVNHLIYFFLVFFCDLKSNIIEDFLHVSEITGQLSVSFIRIDVIMRFLLRNLTIPEATPVHHFIRPVRFDMWRINHIVQQICDW